jgi:xylose isomerase
MTLKDNPMEFGDVPDWMEDMELTQTRLRKCSSTMSKAKVRTLTVTTIRVCVSVAEAIRDESYALIGGKA